MIGKAIGYFNSYSPAIWIQLSDFQMVEQMLFCYFYNYTITLFFEAPDSPLVDKKWHAFKP